MTDCERRPGRVLRVAARALIGPLLALSVGVLGACESIYPSNVQPDRFAPWAETSGDYRFRPGDEVEVRFTYNPEFNDRLLVGPDGRFTMPIIGPVQAGGQTSTGLAQTIQSRYAPTLRNPQVAVTARGYASQQVFVGGEVAKPGLYVIPGPIGALEAVQLAGGFTNTARKSEVVLIRRSDDNKPMMRTVDETAFLNHLDLNQDVLLQASDIIYVPKSTIGEVDLFIDQFIRQVLPFSTNFSYTAGSSAVVF